MQRRGRVTNVARLGRSRCTGVQTAWASRYESQRRGPGDKPAKSQESERGCPSALGSAGWPAWGPHKGSEVGSGGVTSVLSHLGARSRSAPCTISVTYRAREAPRPCTPGSISAAHPWLDGRLRDSPTVSGPQVSDPCGSR